MRAKEVAMTEIERKSGSVASTPVTLQSRDGKVVRVADERDRDFLELADQFVMDARAVQKDRSRQRPRLRFS